MAFTTLELVQAEEGRGHAVFVREPTAEHGLPGKLLYGDESLDCDVECVHSQMPLTSYFGSRPRFLWAHGEPLSSVANGVSMKAIVDMAPKVDAIIAMRKEEYSVWNSIKRTYVVRKGIDLQRFHPIEVAPHDEKDPRSKLSGEPAVLYCEHIRGQRNPLYLCVAMEKVWAKYPKARLHIFNMNDAKMHATFKALSSHAKWWPFLRTMTGPVADADVNLLYNRADVVCSTLFPLYARSVEAFGAGKPLVCPGYRDPEYPFRCELDPDSIADAICQAWEGSGKGGFDARAWAVRKHDVLDCVAECESIFARYL